MRTKDGRIAQIKSIDYEAGIYRFDRIIYINDFGMKENVLYNNEMFKKLIVKHRKQPIDLVEVGDILEIEEEGYEEKYECLKSDKGLSVYIRISDYYKEIEDLKIKRVLTKEQFRQNSYKVGGEDETSND